MCYKSLNSFCIAFVVVQYPSCQGRIRKNPRTIGGREENRHEHKSAAPPLGRHAGLPTEGQGRTDVDHDP